MPPPIHYRCTEGKVALTSDDRVFFMVVVNRNRSPQLQQMYERVAHGTALDYASTFAIQLDDERNPYSVHLGIVLRPPRLTIDLEFNLASDDWNKTIRGLLSLTQRSAHTHYFICPSSNAIGALMTALANPADPQAPVRYGVPVGENLDLTPLREHLG